MADVTVKDHHESILAMLYDHDMAVKLEDDVVDNIIVNKFVEQAVSVLLSPVDGKKFAAIIVVMANNIVHHNNTKNVAVDPPLINSVSWDARLLVISTLELAAACCLVGIKQSFLTPIQRFGGKRCKFERTSKRRAFPLQFPSCH